MVTSDFDSLEGQGIYFRSVSASDASQIHSYASDEEVSKFIGWRLMNTLDETRELIEEMIRRETAGTHLYASIVHSKSKDIIGTAMIFNFNKDARHAEIGYVLNKDYWGMGYGTEAVRLMSNFALESLGLHKLHAQVVDANIGSVRVLEKCGYQLEGRFKDYYFIEGKYYDGLFFGKIED